MDRKFGKRGLIVGGAALLAVAAGVGVAASQPWGGHGHGFGAGGAFMNMRMEWGVNRMLGGVDATAEQKEKVTAIVKSAMADIAPMRESLASARQDAARLLKADKLDRAALEKLRAERIAQADTASKRITQAVADAADVLTPRQRAELVGRLEGFAAARGMGRHGQGYGHGGGPGYGGSWRGEQPR